MTSLKLDEGRAYSMRALLLGERLNPAPLSEFTRIPCEGHFVYRIDEGVVVVFRYGAAVFFGVPEARERELQATLSESAHKRFDEPEVEDGTLRVDPGEPPSAENGVIIVPDDNAATLAVVAEVLARSVALNHVEEQVVRAFERIEPWTVALENTGKATPREQEMLKDIGSTLRLQAGMVGRVEVRERPEILWDRAELERLYLRLEDEYELAERDHALDRKLDLLSRTVSTLVEIQENKRSTRLELYIIALIAVEILLYLYDLWFRGGRH